MSIIVKGTIVIPPPDCREWFTEGREYEVVKMGDEMPNSGAEFWLIDDDGIRRYCLEKGCRHLNDGNWIVKDAKP